MNKDCFMLNCCLPNYREPHVGVDASCDKNALFCIQHNCHLNSEGLMHQSLPLKQFKRKVDQRKFQMQMKIKKIVQNFSNFIDKLIQSIRQIKIKKSLELSMLWLRDLASNQQQYQLMKKVYRLDFQNVSCRDLQSIYFKLFNNKQFYGRDLAETKCYKGICKVLDEIGENKKILQLLSQKVTQIEGVLTNGQILKSILPDRKILNQNLKQVLLQQREANQGFQINYNKSVRIDSSKSYKAFSSKYPIIAHLTYHVSIKTKYSNVMVGVGSQTVKQLSNQHDIHYNENVVLYNLANGSTYKQGMFFSGSNASIKNLNEVNLKIRITNQQVIIMTNKCVLARSNIHNLKKPLYLLFLSRTQGDSFEILCDNDLSSDNIKVLQLIKQQNKNSQQIRRLQQYQKRPQQSQQYQKQKVIDQKQQKKELFDSQLKLKQNKFQQDYRKIQNKMGRQTQFDNIDLKYPNTVIGYETRVDNEVRLSSPLVKIRENYDNLKSNILQNQKFQKERNQAEKQKAWLQQKNKYISQIKQKMKLLNQKNSIKKQMKQSRKPQNYQTHQQNSYENQRIKTKKSDSRNQASVIKINTSDDEVFEINENVSILSGIRKGSDQIQDLKIKDDSIMGQSVLPSQMTYLNFSKDNINKIKTPPKMHPFEKKILNYQQFQH